VSLLLRFGLLASLAAALFFHSEPSQTARLGPAARPAAHLTRPRSTTGPGGARPSPFWLLERRYVALQHEEGRLGAEVRRLRRERLGLLRERRSFHMKARALQAASDPVAAEARAVIDGLLCIHGGEGAWDDPNPPYYGGLQADLTFQANYAPPRLRALGTADHWTPLEQLAVGVIGWSLQGHWAPWPRTSRACGLQ
jgi:hypothetical protein